MPDLFFPKLKRPQNISYNNSYACALHIICILQSNMCFSKQPMEIRIFALRRFVKLRAGQECVAIQIGYVI